MMKVTGMKAMKKALCGRMMDVKRYCGNKRGSFGIKEIALTVAIIVIIAVVTTAIKGHAPTWVTDIWDKCIKLIDDLIK